MGGAGIVAVEDGRVTQHVSRLGTHAGFLVHADIFIAVPVAVEVLAAVHSAVVDDAVAVVVHEVIGNFRGRGVDRGVHVIAVREVRDVARGLIASDQVVGGGIASLSVPIDIGRPHGHVRSVRVHGAITVVVEVIADLFGCRIHRGVGVIAIAADGHVVDGRVAQGEARRVVPVPVAIGVVVPGGRIGCIGLVRDTVTVVVDVVARFRGSDVDGR